MSLWHIDAVFSVRTVSAAIAVSLALAQPSRDVPMYGYQVQHVYPHDSNSFTQGLEYADGFLYEGTGLNGRSSVRRVKLETGEVLKRRDVPAQHFGEGITLWQSDLIELTWKSEVAFVYENGVVIEYMQYAELDHWFGQPNPPDFRHVPLTE